MTTTIDTWVNNAAALIAPTLLPCGATGGAGLTSGTMYRTTLDLTAKNGALLAICLGRLTVVGLTGNIFVNIRRLQLSNAASVPADYVSYTGGNTNVATAVAASSNTIATGVYVVPMAATPTALGSSGNVNVLFSGLTITQASTLTATTTLAAEFARAAGVYNGAASLGGTAVVVDSPTRLARTASELVFNNAEIVGPLFLEGGAIYEISISAAMVSVGGPIAVAAYWEELTCATST